MPLNPPSSSRQYYQGKYPIQNYMKYRGNPTEIYYRSGWELKFMVYCDRNPNIVEWNSEETVIPYLSPVDDKIHRYFVDFWIKVKIQDGSVREFLVEIKPKAQTKEPKLRKKKTRRFLSEALTYETNQAKWASARVYCAKHGMEFLILTEDDLLP
jgi:hypothetical protein